MEASQRDSTQDWLLPGDAAPPLIGELVDKVDEAMAIAKASEKAVAEVGDSALDAARQARRAAEIAERASAAMLRAQRSARPEPATQDAALRSFSERADRVVARLRALERRPGAVRAAGTPASGRRPGG
jgi:hypothetical protein